MQTTLMSELALCVALCYTSAVLGGQFTSNVQTTNGTQTRTNETAAAPVSFRLKPTAMAPVGAAGAAELKPDAVSLHLSHVGTGRFELVAIQRADRSCKPLGTITIVDPTLSPDRQANDNKKEASAHPEAVAIETDVKIALPSRLSPQAIERLVLLGSDGNAMLIGEAK